VKRNHLIFGAIIFCIVIVISGCRKDSGSANWHVDALFPLIKAELTIADIIPDSLLTFDENELVYLSFSDTILRLSLDTLIQLPDTSIIESFVWPAGVEVPPGTQIPIVADEIEIQANDIELRRASIKEGIISLNLESTFPGAVLCTYQIPDAKLNGVPMQISELVPSGSAQSPAIVNINVDVSGYDLDFTNGSQPFNRLPSNLSLVLDPNGPSVQLSPGNSFTLTTTFSGLVPAFAEGYFGQQTTESGSESQNIAVFNVIESGMLDLDAVDVNLRILNGVGVDIRATINQFNAVNSTNGSSIALNHSIVGSPVNLNRATHSGGQISYSSYDIALNNNNSAIDQMLESLPDAFVIDADLELNPLGNISNHHDFAYAESTIEGILDVNIPLCLIANQLQLSDTSDFSIGENGDFDNIISARLNLRLSNGFPLEGWIGLTALIPDESPLMLLDEGYFSAGITNAENVVTAPVQQNIEVVVNAEELNKLRRADQIIIRARFSTSSLSQHVKILSHYKLDVQIIADLNYHVNN